jgi:YARHG domain
MIRTAIIIAAMAACTNDRRPPAPTSGSAALAPIVTIPIDAAPPDAQDRLVLAETCGVGDRVVTCHVMIDAASLRGKRCWRAVVAVENYVEASAELVTSDVACTTDLPSAGTIELAIADSLEATCAIRDACDTMLVDDKLVASETTKFRDNVLSDLTRKQADRRRMLSTDHRSIVDSDWKRLRDHFGELAWLSFYTSQEYQISHSNTEREFAAMTRLVNGLTKGNVACALDTHEGASFLACLQDHVDVIGDLRFPFLSERAITADEIAALSTDDLVIARNEIYARHGYTFKHADLAAYFAKQPWYAPDPAYDESSLTAIERDNVHALLTAETSRTRDR